MGTFTALIAQKPKENPASSVCCQQISNPCGEAIFGRPAEHGLSIYSIAAMKRWGSREALRSSAVAVEPFRLEAATLRAIQSHKAGAVMRAFPGPNAASATLAAHCGSSLKGTPDSAVR